MGPSLEVKNLALNKNKDNMFTHYYGEKAKSVGSTFGGHMLRPSRKQKGVSES